MEWTRDWGSEEVVEAVERRWIQMILSPDSCFMPDFISRVGNYFEYEGYHKGVLEILFEKVEEIYFAIEYVTDEEKIELWKICKNISIYLQTLLQTEEQCIIDIVDRISSKLGLHYSLILTPLPKINTP
jgi:hypothetical protein